MCLDVSWRIVKTYPLQEPGNILYYSHTKTDSNFVYYAKWQWSFMKLCFDIIFWWYIPGVAALRFGAWTRRVPNYLLVVVVMSYIYTAHGYLVASDWVNPYVVSSQAFLLGQVYAFKLVMTALSMYNKSAALAIWKLPLLKLRFHVAIECLIFPPYEMFCTMPMAFTCAVWLLDG